MAEKRPADFKEISVAEKAAKKWKPLSKSIQDYVAKVIDDSVL